MNLRLRTVRILSALGVVAACATAWGAPKNEKPQPKVPVKKAGKPQPMPEDIFPLARVKAGMKGYGLTVFKGTTPEKFEFEVVAVLKNFLPRQDVVLVKSKDPKLEVSGFAQGMSGSPMYLEGKVAGAFSYAFRFSKEAIGAFTPIEDMIREGRTTPRGPQFTAMSSTADWNKAKGLSAFLDGRDTAAKERGESLAWAIRAPLPNLPTAPRSAETRLSRMTVPLGMSGVSGPAFGEAQKMFSSMGLEPMQGGGGGNANDGPAKFEAGGSIGVQLVRGDMSAVGTGTVTYMDGKDRVMGFGHPMFQMGEIYVPVVSATIHTFMASSMISFKLSSPNRELGTLIQDRQSSITAVTNQRAEMIPVDVKIKGVIDEATEFHTEVVRHRFLTPTFVMMSVYSALGAQATDVANQTMTLRSKLYLRGYEPLTFTDYAFAPDGISGGAIGAARGLRAMVPLLFNPFAPVTIDRIEVEADVEYKTDYVEIEQLTIDEPEITPGKPTRALVRVMPFDGKRFDIPVTFTIPKRLAGQVVRLEVSQGDMVRPDVAPPEDLPQLVEIIRKGTYPANTLVLTVWQPDEGVTNKGKILADLPDSVIDSMKPGTSTMRAEPFRSAMRVVTPANRVVYGRVDLSVKVKDEETK